MQHRRAESLLVYEFLCNTAWIASYSILSREMYWIGRSDSRLLSGQRRGYLISIMHLNGYMAPEYIVHGQLTEKADIYSYGILVLEIVTGRKNNNSVDDSPEGQSLMSQIWRQFKSRTPIEMLDPCLRNRCSDEEALKVFQVGLLCSQASPNLRPPMWKVWRC
ncbi:Cysteine-rich receptor-like protein kinase 42 [Ananas comosus]|uniref:Cysteine-rich receptor-like protein kinase 42 n=1 Tax=Ananas comosus TaxID=4615 RepID=A0A199VF04_ANACO|nr:Cysteine-rich receptor-like protein kinase 42 [Ananas comosus]